MKKLFCFSSPQKVCRSRNSEKQPGLSQRETKYAFISAFSHYVMRCNVFGCHALRVYVLCYVALSFSWFIPMASVNMAKLSKEQRKWLQTVRNTERNGLALLAVGWTSERQNRLFCCQLLVSQNCQFTPWIFFSRGKKKKPGLWTSQTNEGCSVPQSMESSKGYKCDTWIRPKFICDAWILQKGARDSRIYQPVCAICLLKYTWPVNFFFHLCDNSHHFPETLYTRREIWGFPFN